MSRRTKHRYLFPVRDANHLRLHVDGEAFYDAMHAAIEAARSFILIEMYLFESGATAHRFIDALERAVSRGASVFLLLDDLGCRGLSGTDRERLRSAGVTVAFYNPLRWGRRRRNLHRDHRKLLLVDGQTAFTGGAGIADGFNPEVQGAHHWHELMLEVQGPSVGDWQALFADNWRHWSEVSLPPKPTVLAVGGYRTRLAVDRGPARQEVKRSLLRRARRARHRLWLATAYFAPPLRLRRALIRAARRGVDVRLLLPGHHTDHPLIWRAGKRFYGHLLHNGVRIFEYQPRFLHEKLTLCDDWVSLGSSNLDHWTPYWNLEANQEVMDAGFAHQVARLFERDFEESIEWRWEAWHRRGRWQRLLERFWGLLDVWITRRSYLSAARRSAHSGRRRRA